MIRIYPVGPAISKVNNCRSEKKFWDHVLNFFDPIWWPKIQYFREWPDFKWHHDNQWIKLYNIGSFCPKNRSSYVFCDYKVKTNLSNPMYAWNQRIVKFRKSCLCVSSNISKILIVVYRGRNWPMDHIGPPLVRRHDLYQTCDFSG